MLSQNAIAFLALVRWSEGTARAPNPWAVTFGREFVIRDFSDHPANLGWPGYLWRGVCETAAGAYQFTHGTWIDAEKTLSAASFGRLDQDNAAINYLVKRAGALELLEGGQIEAVLEKCSATWASFPFSTVDQPHKQVGECIDFYVQCGGSVQ